MWRCPPFATRVLVGVLLVVGGAALVARLADRAVAPAQALDVVGVPDPEGSAGRRFVTTLARTALVVGPEQAQGLALAGLGGAVVGALLVTLPAVSLPSTVMVSRALTWRVAVLTAGVVAAGGLVAAALLPALLAL